DRIVSNGNPPPEALVEDTTKYRTATYREWADAVDQKGKAKSIKPKPDKVDFKFNIHVWLPIPLHNSPFTGLSLEFNMPVEYLHLWRNEVHGDTLTCFASAGPPPSKNWTLDFSQCPPLPDSIQVEGRGLKGKLISLKYAWRTESGQLGKKF